MPLEYVFALCALSTWIVSHVYRAIAVEREILAHPEARSAHTVPTPTGAGIAMVVVFFFVMVDFRRSGILDDRTMLAWLGPIVVAAIGFVDDLKPLDWKVRFPVFLAACAWSMYWVGFPELDILGWRVSNAAVGFVFGTISLLWLQNLYNFMDGIDGLAVAEAAFCCIAVLVISGAMHPNAWNLSMIVFLGVCLGFALINWPGAKVFMGDAGSGFLGLSLGMFALAEGAVTVWVWMILLGWFISDACLTISIRLIRGERIWEGHSLHAYQHLARRFGKHKVLYGILAVNVAWLLPIAWWANKSPDIAVILLVLAYAPLLACQFLLGAGQPQPRLVAIKT
ncbi:MAG: glycosyl transferase [Pseudomonadales bacterium]|nr:glycosyl transferase [Pseudomonadales bacterium]